MANEVGKLVEPLASSEVAAHFLTSWVTVCVSPTRQNGQGPPRRSSPSQPAESSFAGADDPQLLGQRWGSGPSPVNCQEEGGGAPQRPRSRVAPEAAICWSREGKLASCQKTLHHVFISDDGIFETVKWSFFFFIVNHSFFF